MTSYTTVPYGNLLKTHRQAAGLTQEALAERAGVSARNIQNLERGENRPLKDTARRLATALGLEARAREQMLAAAVPISRRGLPAHPAASAGPDRIRLPGEEETRPPADTLTFLIADVRGYTAYTHLHGDAAAAILAARFAALAGEAVQAEDGRVVEVRGDEVLAVFPSARRALRAAVDLIARCSAAASPDLPLRAGVGLDVGEPIAVAGGYRGEVLNVAARLCALAGPGEVLASETVISLARRIEGLTYSERGALELKGLSRPVRAWLVQAAAATSMPDPIDGTREAPLSAPTPPESRHRHNLQATLSSFVERGHEQRKVRSLVESARLVTLSGAGGIGKSRLALAVAEALVDNYPDGVWLVELAALAEPGSVPSAVLTALAVREEPGRAPLDTLVDFLKARHVLLVMDGCEHLLAACTILVTAVLRACAGVHILITSQEALNVSGEHRYRVPTLRSPDPRQLHGPDEAASFEAVTLFVTRAQERRPDFALTERNARAVAEICAQLDGVPLAIELAAARVGSLPVEAIVARLDGRFKLLTSGSHGVLPRQQTLRAALDWSYDLLRENERLLLHRLSVFSGGWSLAAAEAVCAGDQIAEFEVLDLLDSLVSKSLVHVNETEDETRYRLLETVRQYAWERLHTSGTAAEARNRHLAWSVRIAEEAEPQLTGAAQRTWLLHLEVEHDNLRTALGWARDNGDLASRIRLAGALWRFWYMRGYLSEGRSWLHLALAGVDDTAADALPLATTYHGASVLAWVQGDYVDAVTLAEHGLALRRSSSDAAGIAYSLNVLGLVALDQGDTRRSQALLEESLALRRTLSDTWGTAMSLNNLGMVARFNGEFTRATSLHEEGLALQRKHGDTAGMAISLKNLGLVASALGDHARALRYFGDCLTLYRGVGDSVGVAQALEGAAFVARQLGDSARAARLLGAAASLREQIGAPVSLVEQANTEQIVAALRQSLGADFQSTWSSAMGESPEKLIAEVARITTQDAPAAVS